MPEQEPRRTDRVENRRYVFVFARVDSSVVAEPFASPANRDAAQSVSQVGDEWVESMFIAESSGYEHQRLSLARSKPPNGCPVGGADFTGHAIESYA